MNGLMISEAIMSKQGVLLDTSFFIRFLNEADPLCKNAEAYFKYLLDKDFELYISTISIAEYCTRGTIEELPLLNLRVLPFNMDHAKIAGVFAGHIFRERGKLDLKNRNIIPNDTKLFAQANQETHISHYLTSDRRSKGIYDMLKANFGTKFQFIDFHSPFGETFGVLDL